MKPVVMIILDGWGYSPHRIGNAIAGAVKPNLDYIHYHYPSVLLQASGKAVGMTWGEAGNSEVGHLTIGAGRIIFQALSRINKSIEVGEFFSNPVITGAINHAKQNNSTLHLLGLITSGSVHAYFDHLKALIRTASGQGLKQINLHLFTDGKDSGLHEARAMVEKLIAYLIDFPDTQIATIIGRDFAMDRTKQWELTEQAYNLIVHGRGTLVNNPIQYLEDYYAARFTDNALPPIVVGQNSLVAEGDALFFFNFREDSMRQLTMAFLNPDFDIFPASRFENLYLGAMTQYHTNPDLKVAFPTPQIKGGLAETLSAHNLKQLHLAETEKYAHVTFFFNCFNEAPFSGETDILIDSDTQAHHDNPALKAPEIAERACQEILRDHYEFSVINFANPDVLSHTGNLELTVEGISIMDKALEKIYRAVLEKDGTIILTSDHGHAESMLYRGSGEARTEHSPYPVPFYLIKRELERQRTQSEINIKFHDPRGLLADIGPTIIEIMGIEKPVEMTGQSLLPLLGQH